MTSHNETPETELAEVRRLFIKALTDELKSDKPSSAVLNIAQRYIASEAERLPITPPAPAAPVKSDTRFPFPAPASAPKAKQDWAPLSSMPFAPVDG